MSNKQRYIEEYNKAAEFVNKTEFFWVQDVFKHLQIRSNETSGYSKLKWFFDSNIKRGNIVCVEKKGSERQYMRVNLIEKV